MKHSFRQCTHVRDKPDAMTAYLLLERGTGSPIRSIIGVSLCDACTVQANEVIDRMGFIERSQPDVPGAPT